MSKNFFLKNTNIEVNNKDNQEEHPNTIEHRKILEHQSELKASITKNLKQMNFSEQEISEVVAIIDKNSILVEEAKQPLINISADDILNKVEDETKINIKNISDDMLNQLRTKVSEIQSRKK